LIDHRELESLIDDLLGFGKSLVRVSFDESFTVADVAAKAFPDSGDVVKFTASGLSLMEARCPFGESSVDIADARELAVANVDKLERCFGRRCVFRGDYRNRLADETHAVRGDHRAVAQAIAIVWIDVMKIVPRQNRNNAGHSERPAGINGFNGGVGQRAAQYFRLEQTGELKIAGKLRLTGDFFDAVDARS
jgi:hypothetical protein